MKILKNSVFNHKLWANSEIRTLDLSKSWGEGAQTHLCLPLLKVYVGGGRAHPTPFSCDLAYIDYL